MKDKNKAPATVDRFNDLNRQGFMRGVYTKPKRKIVYEVITSDGLMFSGENKIMAELAARKHKGKITKRIG